MKSINRVGILDKNYNKNDTSRVQLQKVLILDLTDISVQTLGMILAIYSNLKQFTFQNKFIC
ncbi:hypothetical protein Hdeb2414_s0004g00143231 [Helianthus debilis subsp. tardiflorus]